MPKAPDQTLTRFDYRSGHGTMGRLGKWVIIEDDWLDNRPRISCIPTGTYLCKRRMYHRGGYETFEITGVPDRSHILIHAGNTEEDSAGCPLIGLTFSTFYKDDEDTGEKRWKIGVRASRLAHKEWMDSLVGVDEFTLHVVDYG